MKEGNGDPSLVLFGEERHAEPSQAGARVRAARQLLRELGRERRRPQLVHRRHRAGLRAEAVAEQLRAAPAALRLRGPGADRRAAGGVSLDQRRTRPASPCATSATSWTTGRRRAPGRAADRRPCATPCWRRSPTATTAASTSTYPDVERAKVFLRGAGRVREDRPDAAPDAGAPGQRPHLRHRAGQDRPALRRGRQRLRAGHACRGRFEERASGRRPPSSCWRTTRRTAPTTWIRTARRRS